MIRLRLLTETVSSPYPRNLIPYSILKSPTIVSSDNSQPHKSVVVAILPPHNERSHFLFLTPQDTYDPSETEDKSYIN